MNKFARVSVLIGVCVFSISAQAHGNAPDPALGRARLLVRQAAAHLRVARRPGHARHGYGGHDARAAQLLRQASIELREARLYQKNTRRR
jgi:hypothetical protein